VKLKLLIALIGIRGLQERLAALELMRQKAYGYDPATMRLQRVLEITQFRKDR